MPVRTGFPTGVKGITQLVHGPQYATGVGLVKFGAASMAESLTRELAAPQLPRIQRASGIIETPIAREKSKFWEWIRLAF
jgi:cell division protein FtsA